MRQYFSIWTYVILCFPFRLEAKPFNLHHGRCLVDVLLQLPGRTDNEIKNYWNTRIKRRMRAGLPVYPAVKAKSSPAQYYVEASDRRSFISGKDMDCDFTSSFSQPGILYCEFILLICCDLDSTVSFFCECLI